MKNTAKKLLDKVKTQVSQALAITSRVQMSDRYLTNSTISMLLPTLLVFILNNNKDQQVTTRMMSQK